MTYQSSKSQTFKKSKLRKRKTLLLRLPAGDQRARFDFKVSDVCLDITKRHPPEVANDPDIKSGVTLYVLRHCDGLLCMITDSPTYIKNYCDTHELNCHRLQ